MSTKQTIAGAGGGAALMAIVLSVIQPSIEKVEAVKLRAYRDIGGVLTVCAGHTGPDVVVNKVYTPAECDKLTKRDIEIASSGILKHSPHLIWHPIQLAAVISFTYNVGLSNYAKSSVKSSFNAGNFQAGCSAMLKYKYVNGVVTQGIINRRNKEYALCTSTLTPQGLTNTL
jgi:lysozyme